jgi:hypothetical protein
VAIADMAIDGGEVNVERYGLLQELLRLAPVTNDRGTSQTVCLEISAD